MCELFNECCSVLQPGPTAPTFAQGAHSAAGGPVSSLVKGGVVELSHFPSFIGFAEFTMPVFLYWRKETGLYRTTFDYELQLKEGKRTVRFNMKECDYKKAVSKEVQAEIS